MWMVSDAQLTPARTMRRGRIFQDHGEARLQSLGAVRPPIGALK
jgi:hypothetical protein